MTITPKDVKLIVSLERQIENHGIKEMSVTTEEAKSLTFDQGTGWKTDEDANLKAFLRTGGRMTTMRALDEIEAAKRILDKHWNSGMLHSFFYNQVDGFQYSYGEGHYEATS